MAYGDEDLAAIFSAAGEFTTLGTFSVNGSPLEVYGIFTDASETTDLLSGQPLAFDKSFTVKSSDVATVKRDRDTVVIDGVTYTVKRVLPTGTGTSLIYLKT